MFYSANELAGLPGLPGTVQGVRWTLNRITETHPEWKRKREGTKAFEYHIDCLPAEAQKVLRKRLTHQVLEDAQLPAVVEQKAVKNVAVRDELEVMVKCPELALREVQSLTDKQKAIADARISDFFDAVTSPLKTINSVIKKIQTVRATLVNTLLTFKSDSFSTVDNVVSLASEPGKFIGGLAEVLEIHTSDVGHAVPVLARTDSATTTGLTGEDSVASSATVMTCWNEVMADMDELVALPVALVSGDKTPSVALPPDASVEDVQDVKAAYAVLAASELASVATAVLSDEAQSEQLIPADIGRLVGDVRTRLQAAITLFRERYEGERERITETASPLGLMYPEIIQSMKNVAASVQDVGLLVLSRRPPLTQKQVQADSCLLLLAWQWYGDYSRAAELQRLNPQLRDPNNITAGMVINAYAK
ncbi:TPA: multidrug DMT transporter permease [Escherichia coli]|uniref:DNA-binding protein n=1 Tax=Escherichia coli TaxID=562 RepID=UPI0004D57B8D|nr:DNA-binding protein [Escherichia coli]KDW06594.1 mu DNA-binding domain protein [Escherichia coli 2-156-04_S3_C1]HBN0461505.1 multidrug DMT transporter permease [Escherichia coli]HBN0502322.1 multidrug DMT transporter permease [Escherichia coli]HBN0672548.1 multidrug DMT transporter permease [Escherichia coli]HCC6500681.1 multidrug DMT transporter permease [Escherichia coli]